MKAVARTAMAVVAVLGLCSAGLAGESDGPRCRRKSGEGGGGGQHRRKGGQQHKGRRGKMQQHRMRAAHRLLNTDTGKALREQFRTDLQALMKQRKAVTDKIREEIKAGKKPSEVLPEYSEDLKAIMKKRTMRSSYVMVVLLDMTGQGSRRGR